MKKIALTPIFANEISMKSMIKKVKEESNNIVYGLGSANSCMALFNIPALKIAQ